MAAPEYVMLCWRWDVGRLDDGVVGLEVACVRPVANFQPTN